MSDYDEDFEDDDFTSEAQYTNGYGLRKPEIEDSFPKAPSKPRKGAQIRKKKTISSHSKSFNVNGSMLLTPRGRQSGNKSILAASPQDRVISAKVRTIKGLQSDLKTTKKELEELRKENRLLNRIQARQEKDLQKYDTREGDFPRILHQHAEEVRMLKSKIQKSRGASEGYKQQLVTVGLEVQRLTERNRKLESVNNKKNLEERNILSAQLECANGMLEEKEKRIAELLNNIQLQNKNHQRIVKQLQAKNTSLQNTLREYEDEHKRALQQIREKEKEIEVKNIYTQRIPRNMPRLLPKMSVVEDKAVQTAMASPPSDKEYIMVPKGSTEEKETVADKKKTTVISRKKEKVNKLKSSPETLRTSLNTVHQELPSKEESAASQSSASSSTDPRGLRETGTAAPAESPAEEEQPSSVHSTTLSLSPEEVGTPVQDLSLPNSHKPIEASSTLHLTEGVTDPKAPLSQVSPKSKQQDKPLDSDGSRRAQKASPSISPSHPASSSAKEMKIKDGNAKALLLAKLQAIDDGKSPNQISSSNSPIQFQSNPLKSNQTTSLAERPPKAKQEAQLEPLEQKPLDFGRSSVLNRRLEQNGVTSSNSPKVDSASLIDTPGRAEPTMEEDMSDKRTVNHFSIAPGSDVKPSQPLLPAHTTAETTTLTAVTNSNRNQKIESFVPNNNETITGSTALTSSSTLLQWPNTVENMHRGKPALASEHDPFGSRLSGSSRKTSSKADLTQPSKDTDSTSVGQAKFGRRRRVDSSGHQTDNRTGPKPPPASTSERVFGGSGPATLIKPKDQTSSGAPAQQGISFTANPTSNGNKAYKWEKEVHVSSLDITNKHSLGSVPLQAQKAKEKLKPLVSNAMPGVIEDDIEELTLT